MRTSANRPSRFAALFGVALLVCVWSCGSSSSSTTADDTGSPADLVTADASVPETTVIETQLPDSLDDVSDHVSYSQQVFSIIDGHCRSCHLSGAGGFTLTGVVATDYAAIFAMVNTNDPASSPILRAGINEGGQHGGGQLFTINSSEYTTILSWVSQGALQN